MRQVRLKADSIRPRPADAVGAHKSGLVRRAGDGFAGFGEERKAALRALGGAYRMSGRCAEDGDGREAGSACRTPRMRQVRLKADSIRPRPADAVGAHKSGLVRRAGDGFAGFGEKRKAALRALGGAYRVKAAAVQRTEVEEMQGGLAHPPGGDSWRDKASGSTGIP